MTVYSESDFFNQKIVIFESEEYVPWVRYIFIFLVLIVYFFVILNFTLREFSFRRNQKLLSSPELKLVFNIFMGTLTIHTVHYVHVNISPVETHELMIIYQKYLCSELEIIFPIQIAVYLIGTAGLDYFLTPGERKKGCIILIIYALFPLTSCLLHYLTDLPGNFSFFTNIHIFGCGACGSYLIWTIGKIWGKICRLENLKPSFKSKSEDFKNLTDGE